MKKYPLHLTNHFNSMNSLKARVQMVYSKQYRHRQLLRFALVLPLLLGSLLISSFNTHEPSRVVNLIGEQIQDIPTQTSSRSPLNDNESKSASKKLLPAKNLTKLQTKKDESISKTQDDIPKVFELASKPNTTDNISTLKNSRIVQIDNLAKQAKVTLLEAQERKSKFAYLAKKDTSDYFTVFKKPVLIKKRYSLILSSGSEYIFQLVDPKTQKLLTNASLKLTKESDIVMATSTSPSLKFKSPKTQVYYLTIQHAKNLSAQLKTLKKK
ncbi:hypothetical protein BKI52_38555 [marine bacterium AO1-C]|nr:hypothetical protein BKI52_38555 [marine bacterium AO1-C]